MFIVIITNDIGTHGIQTILSVIFPKYHRILWYTMLSVIITNGIGTYGIQCLA